jgi:hypothetical protein
MPVICMTTGGVIAAYDDARSGSQSLRIQKLALSDGSRALDPNGAIVLDGLDNDAFGPQAIAMTTGRTAIVWGDIRGSNYALYYQIIATNGQIEKDPNGVRLVPDDAGGSIPCQENQYLCTDGSGGFFCCYEDLRTGTKNIRAAHVNAAGNLVSNPAGEVVYFDSAIFSDQFRCFCAPDGQGGCFVAWSQYDLSYYSDAYVMRIDAQCQRVWETPVRLTDSMDDDIMDGLVPDGAGNCIAEWRSGTFESPLTSTAKIESDGNVVFNRNVGGAENDYRPTDIVLTDGQGGAYYVWTERRMENLGYDIFAQHLNADGEELWTHNGNVVISDTLIQQHPAATLSGNGNLFVVWEDFRDGLRLALYGQKLSPDGNLLWPAEGLLIAQGGGDQYSPVVLPDNGTGMFVAWSGSQNSWPAIYGTHLDSDGAPLGDPYWALHAGGAFTDPIHQYQISQAIASDGFGGFVAVWEDQRSSGIEPMKNIYAQHISDAAGVGDHTSVVPSVYSLAQNYPNPFNPTTQISFALKKAGMTTVKVYDLLGREVTTLVDRTVQAGEHSVTFDATRLASGIYFYRIESGNFTATKKMVLLK